MLKGYKADKFMTIYHFSLVNCDIADDDLAKILKGIKEQGHKLASLVYSRNKLGPKGLKLICELIPYLNELHLDDLKFYDNRDVMRTVMS